MSKTRDDSLDKAANERWNRYQELNYKERSTFCYKEYYGVSGNDGKYIQCSQSRQGFFSRARSEEEIKACEDDVHKSWDNCQKKAYSTYQKSLKKK
jgi:hypothetical protein